MPAALLYTQQELIDALRQGSLDAVLIKLYALHSAPYDEAYGRALQQRAAHDADSPEHPAQHGTKHPVSFPCTAGSFTPCTQNDASTRISAAQQNQHSSKAAMLYVPQPDTQPLDPPANNAADAQIIAQRIRIEQLLQQHLATYGPRPCAIFTAPGRTELAGNHTDHNRGTVVAAAVSLDCVAVCSPRSDTLVHLISEGFATPVAIDIADHDVHENEKETTAAIIRGMAAGLGEAGYAVGGFDACVHSTIPVGAGLSSSAAFEILTARILAGLYNDTFPSAEEQAGLAHKTEVRYFGKPCGEMDQIACAGSGASVIRFHMPDGKSITALPVHITEAGYQLTVINTGGSHADLTSDYAAIPHEMQAAAAVLGHSMAHGISVAQIMANAPDIRKQAGDRALLRLLHFAEETQRAEDIATAIAHNDISHLLTLVQASGDSSWRLLQNCYTHTSAEQPLTVALELTRILLRGKGAWRVHGGGFAGTIQVYVPVEMFCHYTAAMEAIFGSGSVIPLSIRQHNLPVIQPLLPERT